MAGSLRVLLVTLLVLPGLGVPASSQDGPESRPVEGRTNGRPERVLIDAKTNPEAVDKELLIAMVIGSMAIPASPSEQGERRLHLRAAVMGFGREDEKACAPR